MLYGITVIISIILINVSVYTNSIQAEVDGLKNVILVDEAHVLLDQKSVQKEDQAGSANFAVQLVENMIAELRSYRTGIIIADQRPSAVGSSIIANTDIKISFRLTEHNEKEIIGNSSNMDESAIQQLSQLERGQTVTPLSYPIFTHSVDIVLTADSFHRILLYRLTGSPPGGSI